jgi:hypothetical protein
MPTSLPVCAAVLSETAEVIAGPGDNDFTRYAPAMRGYLEKLKLVE